MTKLTSCIAYTRRSCHKLGLSDVAAKLTPALLDLKAEIARLSIPPAVTVERGAQTEPSGVSPIGLDASCQTENEVISRTQCEAIMHNVGSKYMSVLEQANSKIKEQMDTIVSLREQLAQLESPTDDDNDVSAQPNSMVGVVESPTDDDNVVSAQPHSMVGEHTASSSDQVCRADLKRLKEDHLQQRLAFKAQRREHRLARLSQDTQVDT